MKFYHFTVSRQQTHLILAQRSVNIVIRLLWSVCVVDPVSGVTQLHNVVYFVCYGSQIINTYAPNTLSPLAEDIHVEGMKMPSDIVACRRDRQLYVADWDYCIWRVSVDDHSYVMWLPNESGTFRVSTLSLTSNGLLVTSSQPPALRRYSTTDKALLHEVELSQQYVRELDPRWSLFHAVETTRGTFVVSHYITSEDKEQWAVSEHDFVIILTMA